MQLQGKTALVAGAGRNNGKAIALVFAREGADLILLAREKRAELDGAPVRGAPSSHRKPASTVSSKLALELGPYNIRANLIVLSTIANVRANP